MGRQVLEYAVASDSLKMPTCKHFAVGLRACKEAGDLKQALKVSWRDCCCC